MYILTKAQPRRTVLGGDVVLELLEVGSAAQPLQLVLELVGFEVLTGLEGLDFLFAEPSVVVVVDGVEEPLSFLLFICLEPRSYSGCRGAWKWP